MSDMEKQSRSDIDIGLPRSVDNLDELNIRHIRSEFSTMVGVGCMILAVIMLIGAPASIILTIAVVMGACIVGRHRDVCVELSTLKLINQRLAEDNRRKALQISKLNHYQLEDARVKRELASQIQYYKEEMHKEAKIKRYG